jgi:hypothetical protein
MTLPHLTTALGELLGAGDITRARQLIMSLYYEPLVAYVRKIPWTVEIRRSPEYDGDEGGGLVRAFFADRLGRDEVLLAWSRERCQFRHWVRRVMRNFLLAKLAEVRQEKKNLSKFLSQ